MNYVSEVLSDTPCGYWRMAEASGQIQDISGNDNHSTVVNGSPTYLQPGAIASNSSNTAILLDGSTEYYEIPDHATLDVGDVLTLEVWIKIASLAVPSRIFCKGSDAYDMVVQADGTAQLTKVNVDWVVQSSILLSTDIWYHVAATKNGATRAMYVNGVDVSVLNTNQTLVNNTASLFIGQFAPGDVHRFNGTLDELAIYPTALSQERILAHYNTSMGASFLPASRRGN